MQKDKRVRIITGHYGSGKTEFAVNYTLKLAKEGYKTAIADLDIVNPYFRSREIEPMFLEKGIKVVASTIKSFAGDLPALSPEIYTLLQDKSYEAVIDVGGDKAGATVLGRFYNHIDPAECDIFFVLNANRPLTNTKENAIRYIRSIELSSRQKITALVNNTHLCGETSIEDILKGQELCEEVSRELSLPIKYVVTHISLMDRLPKGLQGKIFPIRIYMRKPWETEIEGGL